jgi:hypothetical protein
MRKARSRLVASLRPSPGQSRKRQPSRSGPYKGAGEGTERAGKDLAGYYPGLAEAAKMGIKDEIEVLNPALLSVEMFVVFSKKSPCRSLVPEFARRMCPSAGNE